MFKKILVVLLLACFWATSVAFAYVYGGTNLGYMGYPKFDAFLPYNPSQLDMQLYISEAQEYLDNCDNDIKRIIEAKQEAVDTVNNAIYDYNNGY